ncbi:MAG: thiamine diphosphokinase [Oscillospiraceae bacterium]|nr:thiamine diphosphokinase [Oscillospiraceae bacterium]
MKTCVIFCAAEFDALAKPLTAQDYILAADGGLRHLEKLGVKPHGVIGDFDSLGFIPTGAEVFPVEKDDTDAMLAARKGLELGFRDFIFYGSMDGPRLDHTIANFQTLQFLADHGATGYLVGKDYLVTVIHEETIRFPAEAAGILSLFCLGPDAQGVTIRGLHYPLDNGTLTSGFPLGVSNHFTGQAASITVEKGSLLAMWDRANGFAKREQ